MDEALSETFALAMLIEILLAYDIKTTHVCFAKLTKCIHSRIHCIVYVINEHSVHFVSFKVLATKEVVVPRCCVWKAC